MKVRRRSQRGVALVTVMAMIVIVTIILIAFVAKARTSTAASTSFSQAATADALVQDAANNVVSSLLAEMQEKSAVTISNDIPLYKPNAEKDYLPELDSAARTATTLGVPSLLKTSRSGVAGFTNGPASLASDVRSDERSFNGRTVPSVRWNAPKLLTASQNALLTNAAPQWIYVDRNGPVKLSALSPTLSQPYLGDDPNPEFVIGRYAYRVYDTSGLLDLNAAGFPEAARDAVRAGRKGSLAWLDLKNAHLPGYDASAAVKTLGDWKGPGSNFAVTVDDFSTKYGFLLSPGSSVATGANRFLSRQELIELIDTPAFKSQFTDAEAFLSQTTVFSREVNAPSWAPDQTTPATPAAFNTAVPFVRVRPGKEFTRLDGTAAKAGEPLVKSRFPLSKLALFASHKSATATDRANIEAEIRALFGLEYVESGADGVRNFAHWKYIGDTTHGTKIYSFTNPDNGTRECMLTLDDVASLGREPNFFELLQAGILSDSLGQAMYDYYFANRWTDRNIARHVLQIGLNIIDQYDEDSEPTVVARTPLDSINAYATQPDPDLCGVENIPYIQAYSQSQFRRLDRPDSFTYEQIDGTMVTPFPLISSYIQFQLWNPHRNAADVESASFRIVGLGSPSPKVIVGAAGGAILTPDATTGDVQVFHPSTHWIQFSAPATHSFATPHLLQAGDPQVSASPAESTYNFSGASVLGFWAGDINAPYNGIVGPSSTNPAALYDKQNAASPYRYHSGEDDGYYQSSFDPEPGVTFQLQRQNGDGDWAPVQTLPAITKSLAYQLSRIIRTGRKGDSYIFHQQPTMGSYYSRVDPRTIRFSVGKDVEHASSPGYSADSGEKVVNPQAGESAFPLNARFIMGAGSLGFNPVNGGAALLYPTSGNGVQRHYALGQLWRNTTVATTYHRDRGNQTTRVGDTVPESGSPNPLTTNSARPIVLNRPFKSVAELGYAFRDVPWKSLNLSQDVEGANPQKIPADAALMDLFSLTESPVRAGVINLNTASVEVLTALLAGTDPAPLAGTLAGISQLEAESLAADFRAYLGPRENPLHVIRTAADIARMIQASGTGRQWPKIKREAIVAALADVHNARTWNVLVDVVAQTGRFTSGSKDLAGFSVNAEKRLVMHLAIDRLTGRVVDRLIEPSPEFQP